MLNVQRSNGFGWKPGRGTKPHLHLLRDAPPTPATAINLDHREWWANGWWGDQGQTSQCVIYSWEHVIQDGPITHKGAKPTTELCTTLYQEAQVIDGTAITVVDSGLSCDAGAQAMKRRGWIGEYRWAETVQEVVDYLMTTGPMTIGADWVEGFDNPDPSGLVTFEGGVLGGHQWVMDGINLRKKLIRCKQSWGRQWGKRGFFYFSLDTLEQLIQKAFGQICVTREFPDHYTPQAA